MWSFIAIIHETCQKKNYIFLLWTQNTEHFRLKIAPFFTVCQIWKGGENPQRLDLMREKQNSIAESVHTHLFQVNNSSAIILSFVEKTKAGIDPCWLVLCYWVPGQLEHIHQKENKQFLKILSHHSFPAFKMISRSNSKYLPPYQQSWQASWLNWQILGKDNRNQQLWV